MGKIAPPKAIKLTAKEQKLADGIDFFPSTGTTHDQLCESCERAGKLAMSLIKRNAIPEIRARWFSEPKLNPGASGRSRQEIFEKNGTEGDDILSHGNFLPHLWYFINGPRLPAKAIGEFCVAANDNSGTSGMRLDRLKAFVRKQVRDYSIEKHIAGDEFFKLAIESGLELSLAESLRNAARTVR